MLVTYSKAIQTTSVSTSTSDVEGDSDDDRAHGRKHGGSGHETEDDMRKRLLEEMEEERKALEEELRELKQKTQVKALPGKHAEHDESGQTNRRSVG